MGATGEYQREKSFPLMAPPTGEEPYKGSPAPVGGQAPLPLGVNCNLAPVGPAIRTTEDQAELNSKIWLGIMQSMNEAELAEDWPDPTDAEKKALVEISEPASRLRQREIIEAEEAKLAAEEADRDWFEQMTDADREWLARPKQPLCGFCGGRHKHNPECVALTDGFLVKMPWGKHKGLPVADAPHEYLRWLLGKSRDLPGELKAEIERVLNVATFEEPGE